MTTEQENMSKTISKEKSKTGAAKSGTPDQSKILNQLKQEIRALVKTVEEIQRKHDTQEIIITVPRKRLRDINEYLARFEQETGSTLTLSAFICDAVDAFLWGDEENRRLEAENGSKKIE